MGSGSRKFEVGGGSGSGKFEMGGGSGSASGTGSWQYSLSEVDEVEHDDWNTLEQSLDGDRTW